MPEQTHNGLVGYMASQNLSPSENRQDGAVVLVIDRRYRVFCRPAPFGDLVFECRVADLPASPGAADEMIRECLLASFARMREAADVPVLSDDGRTILLQQRLAADASVGEFEQALEDYANALSVWRRLFRVL